LNGGIAPGDDRIAALVGLTVAAAVTNGMVRPVRRLLDGSPGTGPRVTLAH